MALQHIDSEVVDDRPDLANRMLVGRLWNPDLAVHEHIIFQFEDSSEPLTGTIKGGPMLFGTFVARWEGNHLRVDWQSATQAGYSRGRTFATVERVAGNRVRVTERWLQADQQTRPGFLILEEPMSDDQS
jgi:hypothetical protein